MEFLVTMTTLVPDGTTDEAVAEIRGREAVRSRELAAQGHLLRLWRPPLQPCEWRTIGCSPPPMTWNSRRARLDAIADSGAPIRWLRSGPIPTTRHPSAAAKATEFLTTFTVTIPGDAEPAEVADIKAREGRSDA